MQLPPFAWHRGEAVAAHRSVRAQTWPLANLTAQGQPKQCCFTNSSPRAIPLLRFLNVVPSQFILEQLLPKQTLPSRELLMGFLHSSPDEAAFKQ